VRGKWRRACGRVKFKGKVNGDGNYKGEYKVNGAAFPQEGQAGEYTVPLAT